jgi:hypothetical protein
MPHQNSRWIYLLAGGDVLAVGLFTLVGFTTHGEFPEAIGRMWTTFLPVCAAWGITAPWLSLFDPKIVSQPRQIWRAALACLLAAPLAAWLRGAWLGTPILPVFIAVLTLTLALTMTVWRFIWTYLARKQVDHG